MARAALALGILMTEMKNSGTTYNDIEVFAGTIKKKDKKRFMATAYQILTV
jgi:hypothetical protein